MTPTLVNLLFLGGVIELLGPGARPVSRQQLFERADGTAHVLEYAIAPARVGSGFSTLRVFTTRRIDGRSARAQLFEREITLPYDTVRVARLQLEFALQQYGSGTAPLAQALENRVALLSAASVGASEQTVRLLNLTSLSTGRPTAVPAQARLIGLRPNTDEAWTVHAGNVNQIAITDLRGERLIASFPLRLSPQIIPVALAFSASGRQAWVVARNPEGLADRGFVIAIDCIARQITATISLGTNVPSAAALNPDGTLILIAGSSLNELNSAEPSMIAYSVLTNTSTLLTLGTPNLWQVPPTELIWHPNGLRLFYLHPLTGTLDEYGISERRVTRRFLVPRDSLLASFDLSPTGDFALIRDVDGTASYHLDLETGEILDATPIPVGVGFLLPRP